ncbi:unannotated protein [freshwater metagenome]|uniref:Unannotated protein n=1 Tax=freshwater metagenome TaxID=449393 RepID=A0A6J7XNQ8_9ZZZZ|nr:hypothetical protein [Actinomycetota bacterium]
MSLVHTIAFVIHMLAIIGILTLLIHPLRAFPRTFNVGVIHSAATALVAGVVMVGVQHGLHADNPTEYPLYNNTKIAIKFLIVVAILILGLRQKNKSEFTTNTWATMLGLTIINILIASLWN